MTTDNNLQQQTGVQPVSRTSGTLSTGFTGTAPMSSSAQRIRDAAMQDVLTAQAGSADAPYAEGLRQLEAQKAQARTQKQLAGLGAIQSIGDLHDQIYENQRQQRAAQAAQGFVGGGQAVRQEKAFEGKIGASEGTIERNLLNAVRQGNISIDQLSNQELQALASTGALSKELATEVKRRSDAGEQNLISRHAASTGSSIGAFFKSMNPFGSGAATAHGTANITADTLRNSAYFQNMFKDLGLDINNDQVVNNLNQYINDIARPYERWTPFHVSRGNSGSGAFNAAMAGQGGYDNNGNFIPGLGYSQDGQFYNDLEYGRPQYDLNQFADVQSLSNSGATRRPVSGGLKIEMA